MSFSVANCCLQAIMAQVEVDENGLPISANATLMGHHRGNLIRTHVPISYKTWRHVPSKYKEDVWRDLKVQIPETSFCSYIHTSAFM